MVEGVPWRPGGHHWYLVPSGREGGGEGRGMREARRERGREERGREGGIEGGREGGIREMVGVRSEVCTFLTTHTHTPGTPLHGNAEAVLLLSVAMLEKILIVRELLSNLLGSLERNLSHPPSIPGVDRINTAS